jgi:hypothetical protein
VGQSPCCGRRRSPPTLARNLRGAHPLDTPAPPLPRTPKQDRPWAYWERRTHAVVFRLIGKGLLSLDELRRGVEQLPPADAARSYYEKWAGGFTAGV